MVINEAQALALLDEVNPVPDLEFYEIESSRYHSATHETRSEEQRNDTTRYPTR